MSNLRTHLIRLASTLPKEAKGRKALLDMLGLDSVLSVVMDRDMPTGSTAESYLKDAKTDRGPSRVVVRDGIQRFGEKAIIDAIQAEMKKYPSFYA